LRPEPRAALRLLERGLWSVALVVAGVLGYVALDRVVHDRLQTRKLQELARAPTASVPTIATRPGSPAEMAAPATTRPLENGDPIGRLEIPSVGVSAIVAAGTDARTLRRGIGHIDGTALPGEPGNVGLAGHRDTVFRGLRNLRPADPIFLVTPGGTFEYAIESLQTVAPERSDVLDPSSHPTLTLVTCYPFDFIGPAPLRFIVRAREIARSVSPASAPNARAPTGSPQASVPARLLGYRVNRVSQRKFGLVE
jgi:sortase A